jgi:hypothetical protein
MAVLANFVNGGSVQKVEQAISRINTVTPAPPDLSQLAGTVAVDLQDLSQHTDQIDRLLGGLDATSVSVTDNGDRLATMFGDDAVRYWHRLNDNILKYVGTLLPAIGSIFEGGLWMVPMLESMAGAATSIRSTAEDVPADADALSKFLTKTLVPFLQHPSINVTSVQSPQAGDLADGLADLLRMLGAAK